MNTPVYFHTQNLQAVERVLKYLRQRQQKFDSFHTMDAKERCSIVGTLEKGILFALWSGNNSCSNFLHAGKSKNQSHLSIPTLLCKDWLRMKT